MDSVFLYETQSELIICKLKCKDVNQTNFNIHGLWPNIFPVVEIGFCKGVPPFNMSLLDDLRPELDKKWKNLLDPKSPKEFWKHEYDKHGTCAISDSSLKNERDYFKKALDLQGQFNFVERLQKYGIQPDNRKPYDTDFVLNSLKKEFGKNVQITCQGKKTRPFLKEVHFCVDKSFELIDCPEKPSEIVGEIQSYVYLPYDAQIDEAKLEKQVKDEIYQRFHIAEDDRSGCFGSFYFPKF